MDKAELQTVLWDIAPDKVGLLSDDFVIRRVLAHGTIRMIFTAIAHYGYAAVAREFANLTSSRMDQRRYRYLAAFVFSVSPS